MFYLAIDLRGSGNHGGGSCVGNDTETLLYAMGESNEQSYHRWQLAHIKNKSDVCSYFEEVLGIQVNNHHRHHNRHHQMGKLNSTKPLCINHIIIHLMFRCINKYYR